MFLKIQEYFEKTLKLSAIINGTMKMPAAVT